MKKIIPILAILLFTSCTDWLNVMPKTSIPAKNIFASEDGFKDALEGIYLKMGAESLYGKDLTIVFMDELARMYTYPMRTETDYTNMNNFSGVYEHMAANIYSDMYNIIVNINNILHYLEKNRSVLKTQNYYEIIKGEALALRAFLHFDLLRMFGPVYSINPDMISISYRTNVSKYAEHRLKASEVVNLIEADLILAHKLLDKSDSKLFFANDTYSEQDPFLRLRQLRMNIYAVKALFARLYSYKGDTDSKVKACKYAREVIDSGYFLLQNNNQNQILFGEHIFSINVYQLDKRIKKIFENRSEQNNWSISDIAFVDIFGENIDNNKDFRRNQVSFISKLGGTIKTTLKYSQSTYTSQYRGKDIIPLIRIPEMYYIIAECDTDIQESYKAIETVRKKRSAYGNIAKIEYWDKPVEISKIVSDKKQTNRIAELVKEYMKEFYAEGQLFYFYKKHNFEQIYPKVKMKPIYYVFKTPKNEYIFGNNN